MLPPASIWSGHHWWSHCLSDQGNQAHMQASANTVALLCLKRDHKPHNDEWHLTEIFIPCLIKVTSLRTFKHLSQRQVVNLWIAELEIFIGVPGDASTYQRNLNRRTAGSTIGQREGVWDNRCELIVVNRVNGEVEDDVWWCDDWCVLAVVFTIKHAVGCGATGGNRESVLVFCERLAIWTGVLVKEQE